MLKKIIDLCYPNVCGFCGTITKEVICTKCILRWKECKQTTIQKNLAKSYQEYAYLFPYTGLIRQRMIQYKFYGATYLYRFWGQMICQEKSLRQWIQAYDCIIPVPIHPKRKRKRGFNQAELVAKEIGSKLDIPVETNVLYKLVHNPPQSSLNKEKRKRNILQVYRLRNQYLIQGKKVLLLDDIYTTGNTVEACSRVIQQASVKKIGVLTISKD